MRGIGAVAFAITLAPCVAHSQSAGGGSGIVPRHGQQPSFDCEKAATPSARLICADGELARLDAELGAAFQKYKSGIAKSAQSSVVTAQLAWIKDRNTRCGLDERQRDTPTEALADSKSCMLAALRGRIAALAIAETHARQQAFSDPGSTGERAATATTRNPQDLIARRRCLQGSCFWVRLDGQSVVQTDVDGGRLVRTSMRSAEIEFPDFKYDNRPPTTWKESWEGYAFCSRRHPAVIYPEKEGGWVAELLAPGYPDVVFDAARDWLVDYFLVCHNLTKVDLNDPSIATKYGYPSNLIDRVADIQLASPVEILDDKLVELKTSASIAKHAEELRSIEHATGPPRSDSGSGGADPAGSTDEVLKKFERDYETGLRDKPWMEGMLRAAGVNPRTGPMPPLSPAEMRCRQVIERWREESLEVWKEDLNRCVEDLRREWMASH